MKKIMIFLAALALSFSITANWTPISKDKAEENAIRLKIAAIQNEFARYDVSCSSPALQTAIFQLLKNIGTPASYKILQEMVAGGDLDKSYLNAA